MEKIWPLWALPFWTMGVPLIWAVVELFRTPSPGLKADHSSARPRDPAVPAGKLASRA